MLSCLKKLKHVGHLRFRLSTFSYIGWRNAQLESLLTPEMPQSSQRCQIYLSVTSSINAESQPLSYISENTASLEASFSTTDLEIYI
jgi:hypothetical protein